MIRLVQFLLGIVLISYGVYGISELVGVNWLVAAVSGVVGVLLIITMDWMQAKREHR